MKKIFYSVFASALLLAGGCAKEIVNPEDEKNNDVQKPENVYDVSMKSVSLEAAMPLEVKSLVNDEGEFSWTSDDAIAVNVSYVDADGNDVNSFFKLEVKEISAENDNVATFEGEIPESGTMTGVAVYPYDEGHVYADGKLSVNFPTEVSETNHLPVMYANLSEGEALQFKHLSSMLKLTYKYVPKDTDGLTLTSEAVAGLYDVDLETGALTATEKVSDQVKVSFDKVKIFQEQMSVYVPVPAGERAIAANLNNGEDFVKWSSISSKSAREFKAGHITLLPAYSVHFTQLYVLGAAPDMGGWSAKDKLEPITEVEDHIFTWTGNIFAGNRFRFAVQKGEYYPAICNIDGNPQLYFGENNNNLDFKPSEDGNYTLTVDATNMDNIKVDMKFNYKAYPDKYLFINGKATEKMGYQKAAEDWMWMTQVEPGVFEWTGHLAGDVGTDFKFRAKDGEWSPYYDMDVNAEDKWTLHYSNGETDNKFAITQGDGLYRVTANLNTMKASCELLESCDRLYITGYSVSTSGFSKTPGADFVMHYAGNGIYTWSGQMYVTGVKNGFKILRYNGWNPHWGPTTGSNVGMDGTATYHTEGDYKWILKEADGYRDGEYNVVLDTINGTLTITPM